MNELANTLANKIIKQLNIYHAIGEVKLFEMIAHSDTPGSDNAKSYQEALGKLYRKGMIEIVSDKTNSLNVIRLINIYH